MSLDEVRKISPRAWKQYKKVKKRQMTAGEESASEEKLAEQRREIVRLKMSAELVSELLEAAASQQPIPGVVKKLSDLVHGSAWIYDLSGKIVYSSGTGPARLIWNEYAAGGGADGTGTIGHWHARARRIAQGPDIFLLAVAAQDRERLEAVADTALASGAQILRTVRGINSAAWTNQQYYGQSLLSQLRVGITPAREVRVMDQLAPYGFAMGDRMRFAMLVPVREDPRYTQENLLDRALERGLGIVLARSHEIGAEPGLLALVRDAPVLDDWLQFAGAGHVIGVSEAFSTLTAVPDAVQEAETATMVAGRRRRGTMGFVVRLDEVSLATWLRARVAGPVVGERTRRELAALGEHEQLVDTLVTWLRTDMDVKATAAELFVHPNSIRYRLQRCEQLLGKSLRSPATITNLFLALEDRVMRGKAS